MHILLALTLSGDSPFSTGATVLFLSGVILGLALAGLIHVYVSKEKK